MNWSFHVHNRTSVYRRCAKATYIHNNHTDVQREEAFKKLSTRQTRVPLSLSLGKNWKFKFSMCPLSRFFETSRASNPFVFPSFLHQLREDAWAGCTVLKASTTCRVNKWISNELRIALSVHIHSSARTRKEFEKIGSFWKALLSSTSLQYRSCLTNGKSSRYYSKSFVLVTETHTKEKEKSFLAALHLALQFRNFFSSSAARAQVLPSTVELWKKCIRKLFVYIWMLCTSEFSERSRGFTSTRALFE